MRAKVSISSLLSYGGINSIAKQLGLTPGAVSAALRRGNPGHAAVREAIRIANASGAVSTAQTIATLNIPS